MSLILANNETIVKSYQYAQTHTKSGMSKTNSNQSLIVTNKRIIHRTESEIGVYQDEIPMTRAEYLSCGYTTVRNLKKLILALFFMLVGVMCAVFALKDGEPSRGMLIAAAALLVIGIIFLILYFLSRVNSVACVISASTHPSDVLAFASHTYDSRKNKKKKKSNKQIVITVDRNVAKDLVNGLGALLLNLQANPDAVETENTPETI